MPDARCRVCKDRVRGEGDICNACKGTDWYLRGESPNEAR